jgi:predicted AAA+ superfamily ATPase
VGRLKARDTRTGGALLALDEVPKVTGWSETVKRLWDEDGRRRVPLKVLLLGSSPLLLQRGLTESLSVPRCSISFLAQRISA